MFLYSRMVHAHLLEAGALRGGGGGTAPGGGGRRRPLERRAGLPSRRWFMATAGAESGGAREGPPPQAAVRMMWACRCRSRSRLYCCFSMDTSRDSRSRSGADTREPTAPAMAPDTAPDTDPRWLLAPAFTEPASREGGAPQVVRVPGGVLPGVAQHLRVPAVGSGSRLCRGQCLGGRRGPVLSQRLSLPFPMSWQPRIRRRHE